MSKQYTEKDFRHIVDDLIDYLRECEEGTDITTWQLLQTVGYDMDGFGVSDLMEIHDKLFKAARSNRIILDMSSHENMVEGLPYNLDFIVHNKKAQIKCPYCGSKNTARVLYGYPDYSDDLQKKLDERKISLGGCRILEVPVDGEMIQTNPTRECNDCKKKFGKPPLIIAKDWRSAEDYRDIVTSIHFHKGGFHQGYIDITITRNEKEALVKVIKFPDDTETPKEKRITIGKWSEILNSLYCRMYLHEWKKNYYDNDVLDGEQWELKIKLSGKRRRNYSGSNAYPPYWPELTKLFREYTK